MKYINTINAHMYTEILDDFFFSLIENCLGNDEVIFQDNNASCLGANEIKAFHQERYIKIRHGQCEVWI